MKKMTSKSGQIMNSFFGRQIRVQSYKLINLKKLIAKLIRLLIFSKI